MAEYFAGGHLRFLEGEWRDDNGDVVNIKEEKYGEWIEIAKDSVGKAFMCSVCGAAEVTETFDKSPLDNDCNYCYRCGTKMKPKEEDR